MKKIGIVGGVAWRSTVEYYEGICTRCERLHRERGGRGPAPMPELVIESLDLATAVSYLGVAGDERSWRRFDAYHRQALQRIESAGADFAVVASNTPHDRLDAITIGVHLPVLGIFHETARACARLRARRALILGTPVTMASHRLVEVFRASGTEAVAPRDVASRSEIQEVIASLQAGRKRGAAGRIHGIVERTLGRPPAPGSVVCLCCTELPLAFPPPERDLTTFEVHAVRYINSTAAHIEATLERAMGVTRGDARRSERRGP